ncbi:MAG: response regulator [Calditrichaeota bacterium]|nr:MAG: response regulator [Calditrichota bacterium]
MANILIVDDEPEILEQLPEIMKRWGHTAFIASNGFDALQVFEREPIDLILSDIRMPEMDGLQLLQKIQDIDKQCPVLFLTGYPSDDSAIEAMHSGADDYLVKPVNFDELQLRINKSLERKERMKTIPFLKGMNWALLISIPFWLILGIIIAKLFKS